MTYDDLDCGFDPPSEAFQAETEIWEEIAKNETQSPTLTPTGHTVGVTYVSSYWGYTYKVLGPAGEYGVRVECLDIGPHNIGTLGEAWSHSTRLDPRDKIVS